MPSAGTLPDSYPERRRALGWYLTGLLLDGERKTIVSMAGRLIDDESEIEAMRQAAAVRGDQLVGRR